MADDELRFLCRETGCQFNNKPYCDITDGRPVIIGPPHGTCQQLEEKKEASKHEE